jgi:hypothetical protein
LRGIALLTVRDRKPRGVTSASGIIAMISTWLFVGLPPYIARELLKVYQEFDLGLPRSTELTLSICEVPLRMGFFWFPIAFALGLCALVLPEILFSRPSANVTRP